MIRILKAIGITILILFVTAGILIGAKTFIDSVDPIVSTVVFVTILFVIIFIGAYKSLDD